MIESLYLIGLAVDAAKEINALPAWLRNDGSVVVSQDKNGSLIERWKIGTVVMETVFEISIDDVVYIVRFSFPNDSTPTTIDISYDAAHDNWYVYWIIPATTQQTTSAMSGLTKPLSDTMLMAQAAAKRVGADSAQPKNLSLDSALHTITTLIEHANDIARRDRDRI